MFDQSIHDAPDVHILWNKTPVARKPHECGACHDTIAPGEKYESVGFTLDGEFHHEKQHFGASLFPRGCPKYRARDIAEAEQQIRADQERFFPHAN